MKIRGSAIARALQGCPRSRRGDQQFLRLVGEAVDLAKLTRIIEVELPKRPMIYDELAHFYHRALADNEAKRPIPRSI